MALGQVMVATQQNTAYIVPVDSVLLDHDCENRGLVGQD